MTHYRYEHDPSMSINLEADTDILQDHQVRLQRLAAAIAKDLDIITNEIVARAIEGVE